MNRRQTLTRIAGGLLAGIASTQVIGQRLSRWRQGARLPFAVQEIYPALYQGEIYVAGGIGSRLGVPFFTDRCVAYNVATDRWRDVAALPEPLHHAALIADPQRLLLVGGFNGSYTHIWRMRDRVLQLTDDGWQRVSNLPKPQAEGVLTLADDGQLHLVTGQSPIGEGNRKRSHHQEIADHWVWDGSSSPWQAAAPIPTPRNSATGGWVDGQLIIVGGRTSTGNLATNEIYDPKSDRWHSARPMPLPQAGSASVVSGHDLVVFGGEIFVPEAGVFKEVWRYKLASDTWESLPALPTPRHGLGAVRIGSEAFVLGGATKPSGSGTSKALEILELG